MKKLYWLLVYTACVWVVQAQETEHSKFIYNGTNWPQQGKVYNILGQVLVRGQAAVGQWYVQERLLPVVLQSKLPDIEEYATSETDLFADEETSFSVSNGPSLFSGSGPVISPAPLGNAWFLQMAATDSNFASALAQYVAEVRPQFEFCQIDTAWFKDAVTPVAQQGKMLPKRAVGTWLDSLVVLQKSLLQVSTLQDTFLVCLHYSLRNQLKGRNEYLPNNAPIHQWSFATWFQHFSVQKNIVGNCGVYTPFFARVLFAAAGIKDMVIFNVGNNAAAHTFLLVQVRGVWYAMDPTYEGIYMLDNRLAGLHEIMPFLYADTVQPYQRFSRLSFYEGTGSRETGLLVSKFDLWGMWSGAEPNGNRAHDCRQVYQTHTVKPNYGYYDSIQHLGHYVAALPYTPTDTLVEVRFEQIHLSPNDEGSMAYQDVDGTWWREGFRGMFNLEGLPIHFSSMLLMPMPSLNGKQALKSDAQQYFH